MTATTRRASGLLDNPIRFAVYAAVDFKTRGLHLRAKRRGGHYRLVHVPKDPTDIEIDAAQGR